MTVLKIKMNLGDHIQIGVGKDGTDFVDMKRTVVITLEADSKTGHIERAGKVDIKQLETFAIDLLVDLGYRIQK